MKALLIYCVVVETIGFVAAVTFGNKPTRTASLFMIPLVVYLWLKLFGF